MKKNEKELIKEAYTDLENEYSNYNDYIKQRREDYCKKDNFYNIFYEKRKIDIRKDEDRNLFKMSILILTPIFTIIFLIIELILSGKIIFM